METNEKILFSNSFGKITEKRIILNYKSGTEDLPVRQITSVSFQHERNIFFAIGSILISFGGIIAIIENFSNLNGMQVLLILLLIVVAFLSGVANWIGHHKIQLSAGGNDRKPLKVEMSKTREGLEFVKAIRKKIIK